ncbi:diaminopimelate decarboxylase family protein [Mycobacterium vicinigordonae]|uniref:Diaminopimelate decarboxylase n=1 Tax=Mycobacterium vicinigordonae TaxID=1719132 RepID=A0A7D6HYY4_9MYCO|nr:diaminopimelate decarboxylase [Mycobacterium vicinigordonae]QLL10433.1 diaminopimelate decarboxylase [Mycobacterium vicinigordonae]
MAKAAPRRLDPTIWPATASCDKEGRICVGGVPLTDVADEFDTPAYVIDEADFRQRARRCRRALRDVEVVYPGKSLLATAVARWAREEGLGLDVTSPGELAVGLAGGVDAARIIMHSNAKSPDELRQAVSVGVGRIVLDSNIEIAYLAGLVRERQRVLIRVTPDIEVAGQRPQAGFSAAFGFTLDRGHAVDAVGRVLAHPILDPVGLHCHLPRQGAHPTDAVRYGQTIHRMIAAMADIRTRHGVILTELHIGGGLPLRGESQPGPLSLGELAAVIDNALDEGCAGEHFPRPTVVVEPGAAISAQAAVALYRVCSVNTRPSGRVFVTVDGATSDYPGSAPCQVALANRHPLVSRQLVTVAGRHCEAGEEIARDVELPADVRPGDLLAVAGSAANHGLVAGYNLVGRPPLVSVYRGRVRELVRRETTADLLARDCLAVERGA